MPEGDTVWLAGRNLNSALGGQVLTTADLRVPRYATADLAGRVVHEVVSVGKHLLFRFSGGLTLHTHFRMDGTWHLYRPGDRWHGGPAWQIRTVLGTAGYDAVGYRLPVVDLVPTSAEAQLVGHLGPDVLGADWSPAQASANLVAQGERAIGAALLDQTVLAGLGNLYRTEVCFLSGITPWTPTSSVADLARVVDLSHRLLKLNKDRALQVSTGDTRRGRWHFVFEQKRCLRCGGPVSTNLQDTDGRLVDPTAGTGRQRLTYWCAHCQAGPSPASRSSRELLGPRTVGRTRYSP